MLLLIFQTKPQFKCHFLHLNAVVFYTYNRCTYKCKLFFQAFTWEDSSITSNCKFNIVSLTARVSKFLQRQNIHWIKPHWIWSNSRWTLQCFKIFYVQWLLSKNLADPGENRPHPHHICSLIFFPSNSIVLILKSIPEKKEIKFSNFK